MGKSQPQRGTWNMTFFLYRKNPEQNRRWYTTLSMLSCILKKVNFTSHGFLFQKITLKNMIGAIGNIQFSFLQRFTFIPNSTHICTTECGTFRGQECQMLWRSGCWEPSEPCAPTVRILHYWSISPVPLPMFYVLNVTKRLSTKLMLQVNRKFLWFWLVL